MPKHFRLKGPSLEAIRDKAVARHGAGARIIAAEKVSNPGIAGLFAGDRFEATVEVPDAVASTAVASPLGSAAMPNVSGGVERTTAEGGSASDAHPALRRTAIAALLEEADASERLLHTARPGDGRGPAVPPVSGPNLPAGETAPAPISTAGADFAGLLAQLGSEYGQPPPAVVRSTDEPRAPKPRKLAPLAGAGDLVLLLGLGDDALGPALEISMAAGGCDVRTGGKLSAFGHLHVADRQSATAARASSVTTGQTLLLAYGLGRPRDVAVQAALLDAIGADQVWAVVDARRKAEDTAAWLAVLADRVSVDALAVVGSEDTLSPGTVDGLGLPVGWLDGRKVD
ncbi:hypothetical protein AB0N71_04590 [Pseudarthrobacter enclensis]|uniref:hypothetical protein n=1 Tax=Pseudarthrobacter enclensis TaxID=993070 RepID=UPI003430749E